MEIIKYIFIIFLIAIFYKDGVKKLDNVYKYYLIIEDFNLSEKKGINKFLTSLLISLELIIVGGILFKPTQRFVIIVGICLEIFYLYLMIKNYNKSFKHGCKCYIINATDRVELTDIMKLMLIIFIFISILIF